MLHLSQSQRSSESVLHTRIVMSAHSSRQIRTSGLTCVRAAGGQPWRLPNMTKAPAPPRSIAPPTPITAAVGYEVPGP